MWSIVEIIDAIAKYQRNKELKRPNHSNIWFYQNNLFYVEIKYMLCIP